MPVYGRPVNSCLTLAVMKDESNITMFEGLTIEDVLHPLRQAFIDHDAFQCRYCTLGEICTRRRQGEERRREAVIFCRCGAYPNIVAVNAAPNQPAAH